VSYTWVLVDLDHDKSQISLLESVGLKKENSSKMTTAMTFTLRKTLSKFLLVDDFDVKNNDFEFAESKEIKQLNLIYASLFSSSLDFPPK